MKRLLLSVLERKKLSLHGRRLAVSLFILLFVIYAFLAFSRAWFSKPKTFRAIANNAEVILAGGTSFTLYQWNGTTPDEGTWVPLTNVLDFTDAVPNEVRRYMIVTDGAPISEAQFALAGQNPANANPQGENIMNYVFWKKISSSSNAVSINPDTMAVVYDFGGIAPAFLGYDSTGGATAFFAGENSISVGAQPMNALVFDIYISKNVCNYFENWGFSGTITVA